MSAYRIAPIDIDFAGWCIVPEGDENAWGVFMRDELVVAKKTREAAEQKLAEVERGNP